MFDFLDRPLPTIKSIKEKYRKKHHPIQYVIDQTVSQIDGIPTESQTKTLLHLSTAEKNYSANNPTPSYIRKAIGGFLTFASIFAITNAEKFDTFPTKAWPFVHKDKDQD